MKPILIIGGGITGVSTAVELAETGKEVILVEKESYLGGNVVRMHSYFPKLCPPACGMEINFRRIKNSSKIRVITNAEVTAVSGAVGDFKVKIKKSAELVNDLCTACGDCREVCPAERSDAFNYDLGKTKAIYLPYPLAYPQKYTIDEKSCEGTSCSKCVEACSYGAIDLMAAEQAEEIEVHALVAATGWKSYDASLIKGLNYGQSDDIVTNVEFERLLEMDYGKVKRPSTGDAPKSIAFVQCAGSRDENHLPYCSAVCCSASLKHALNVAEKLPDTKIFIHYIDLRVTGRNEDFLRKVEEHKNIELIKGKVALAERDAESGQLIIEAENIAKGRKGRHAVDMLVLATGIVPNGTIPGMKRNADGFAEAVQPDGLIVAGCAKKPMDVSTSVKDATSAAIKSLKINA